MRIGNNLKSLLFCDGASIIGCRITLLRLSLCDADIHSSLQIIQ
jgi:hypothetical protein